MNRLTFAGVCFSLIFSACTTTPKRSSKLAYLGDGLKLGKLDTAKMIREDLTRTAYVLKDSQDSKEQPLATSTWLSVYPHSPAMIRANARKKAEEEGFKKKWSQEKIDSEIAARTKKSLQELSTHSQCFSVELNSNDRSATEMEHWHGSLVQNGKSIPLKFSTGGGFVRKTRRTYVNTYGRVASASSYDTRKYYYFATACTEAKPVLTSEFSLKLEPRYERGLHPVTLSWLKPTP